MGVDVLHAQHSAIIGHVPDTIIHTCIHVYIHQCCLLEKPPGEPANIIVENLRGLQRATVMKSYSDGNYPGWR